MKISHSWAKAARSVSKRIGAGAVSTLSLDVFDTLLIRTTSPDFVIDATCRYVASKLDMSIADVKSARNRAWNIQVSRSISVGFDAEAKASDQFSTWMRLLVGDCTDDASLSALASEILSKELDFEAECLRPNNELSQLARYAKSEGVKVVAVSDMYLESCHIGKLLAAHGIGDVVDEVVSSADHLLQKKTGRLFSHLIETGVYGTAERKRIVHLGDDLKADGLKCAKEGFRAIVVNDRSLMSARSASLASDAERDAASVCNDILMHSEYGNDAEELGATRFGPVYAGFIHKVADTAASLGLNSIWFLAREGWMLHELYQLVLDAGIAGGAPPSGYLYASRLSTMRAQLDVYGQSELKAARDNTSDHSIGSILSPLAIPADELNAILNSVSLTAEDVVTDDLVRTLSDCPDFERAVSEIGRAELEGIRAYLLKTGFPQSGRIGLVDVGWGGQIQQNIERIVRKLGWSTEIYGLYLGTDHRAEPRRDAGMHLSGLISDSRRGGMPGVGAFSFVQGLELATRSQHASVKGYSRDGIPILADGGAGRMAESEDDPAIANIQLGVIDYCKRYYKRASMIGLEADQSVEHARDIVDLLSLMPTRREAEVMLSFNNVANLGMEGGLLLGGKTSVFSPRRLVRTLKTTLWQEGTCAAAMPTIGPMAFMLNRKRRGMLPAVASNPDPNDPPNATHPVPLLLVADTIGLDLTAQRKSCASLFPSQEKRSRGRANIRCQIADAVGLVFIRKLHGGSAELPARKFKTTIKAISLFARRHPFAQLAKTCVKRIV